MNLWLLAVALWLTGLSNILGGFDLFAFFVLVVSNVIQRGCLGAGFKVIIDFCIFSPWPKFFCLREGILAILCWDVRLVFILALLMFLRIVVNFLTYLLRSAYVGGRVFSVDYFFELLMGAIRFLSGVICACEIVW